MQNNLKTTNQDERWRRSAGLQPAVSPIFNRLGQSSVRVEIPPTAAQPRFAGYKPAIPQIERSALRVQLIQGFTLIELLIVIAIIAILAAMVIPITGAVNRNKIRSKARVDLEQIATAIDNYKSKLGHYPPDNRLNPGFSQLYFELMGTTATNINGQILYVTLDGSARASASSLNTIFGAGGIMNASQGTGGDEGRVAIPFLPGLKPDQYETITNAALNPNPPLSEVVKVLINGIPAQPLYMNTVFYNSSSPTNNPNTYDLWVDVLINGKTNRISNWSQQTLILP